jgi:hypothetical protein|nr:MAG TPA_asm: hypothetical protein [Caudoviricetes sp.]
MEIKERERRCWRYLSSICRSFIRNGMRMSLYTENGKKGGVKNVEIQEIKEK